MSCLYSPTGLTCGPTLLRLTARGDAVPTVPSVFIPQISQHTASSLGRVPDAGSSERQVWGSYKAYPVGSQLQPEALPVP